MTTGPNDYAERAARAFNCRDVESMLALVCEDFIYRDEEVIFDSAVLMPSAEQQEG